LKGGVWREEDRHCPAEGAKPEAVAFYERYGFVALEGEAGHLSDRPEPTPMFLEIGAIPKSKAAR
jgi:hypothetical protein